MEVSSIVEQMLFTTVRVQTRNSEGKSFVGTAFIFSHKYENKDHLFLVTNKHVVNDAREGVVTFIKRSGQNPSLGHGYNLRIENFEKMWFGHKKESIDVAVAPFVPILNHIHAQGVEIFLSRYQVALFQTKNL